jgi:HEAT repeat protein
LKDQVPKLVQRLSDPDLRCCLAVNQALEATAGARSRLRQIRQTGAGPAEKQLDDVMAEGLRTALPALSKELSHKEVRVRLAALYVLETLDVEAVPAAGALAAALKNDNSFVRWGAVRALGKMAPLEADKAVPGLAGVVEDANGDVRGTALFALQRYRRSAKAAVPALTRALKREDAEMRVLAIQALGAVGPEARPAVPGLVDALAAKETEVRAEAAKALGRIDPSNREAEAALIKALNDPESEVRMAASDALLVGK